MYIMRYLAGTCKYSLVYDGRSDGGLYAYCDSSHRDDRSDPDHRNWPTQGYHLTLANGCVKWHYRTQTQSPYLPLWWSTPLSLTVHMIVHGTRIYLVYLENPCCMSLSMVTPQNFPLYSAWRNLTCPCQFRVLQCAVGFFFFRSNLSPFRQSPCQTLQLNKYTTKGPNAFPNCHDFPSPTWQWGSLDSLLTFMTVVKFIF